MTYIFEMASGTEYAGDDLSCPSAAASPGAPVAGGDRQVALQLAVPEACGPGHREYPPALYLDALISKLED